MTPTLIAKSTDAGSAMNLMSVLRCKESELSCVLLKSTDRMGLLNRRPVRSHLEKAGA